MTRASSDENVRHAFAVRRYDLALEIVAQYVHGIGHQETANLGTEERVDELMRLETLMGVEQRVDYHAWRLELIADYNRNPEAWDTAWEAYKPSNPIRSSHYGSDIQQPLCLFEEIPDLVPFLFVGRAIIGVFEKVSPTSACLHLTTREIAVEPDQIVRPAVYWDIKMNTVSPQIMYLTQSYLSRHPELK